MFAATAKFQLIDGLMFRWDTRLWLRAPQTADERGICVGAVTGLNPGSSHPTPQRPGFAEVDRTMGRILTAFAEGSRRAGIRLPENSYVRMWNLFYLCNPDSGSALNLVQEHPKFGGESYRDPTEKEAVPFVWYAWTAGTPEPLRRMAPAGTEPACWLCSRKEFRTGTLCGNDRVIHPLYVAGDLLAELVATMLMKCRDAF